MNKSDLIPMGRVESEEMLVAELGCNLGSLPIDYLGLPLGAKYKSKSVWDRVEERYNKRLALWKRQYIFKGGSNSSEAPYPAYQPIPSLSSESQRASVPD